MHRLVYYSRNAIAGDGAPESEIRQILDASRRNNDAAGVTGALMFNAGCFAQVLEGPLEAVQQTFERIQRDDRHSEVVVVDFRETAERGFPSWSMAYIGQCARGHSTFGGIADESGFEPGRMDGERIFTLLRELVAEQEAAGAA